VLDGLLIKLARKPYFEKLLREQAASPPIFGEISEELKLKFLLYWPLASRDFEYEVHLAVPFQAS
jgi:hypothetical protein